MTTEKLQKDAGAAVAASPAIAAAPVVHAEPKKGGSYTRNLATGELERSSPQVADPTQE
jgi:hypothetical protein